MTVLIESPPQTAVFMSSRAEYRMIYKPGMPVYEGGQKVGETESYVVAFRDHRFFAPVDGEVRLENGATLPASEVIPWMRRHAEYGMKDGGFWEVEPVAPDPTGDELTAIAVAAAEARVEDLKETLAAERRGYNRQPVVEMCERLVKEIETRLEADED